MQAKQIPNIHQQPRLASDTAPHYGYVAFKDINLNGSTGKEYWVQPENSPYYNVIPCRELIPFTNIAAPKINEDMAATTSVVGNRALPVTLEQKTAKACAEEMETAYAAWDFKVLRDLTGLSREEAGFVFYTIQPFPFLLKDILDELEYEASERIAQTEPYVVSYNGEEYELQPLPAHLKEIAENVRARMAESAQKAFSLGEETKFSTTQSITQFYATGTGKRRADPHDAYIFREFGEEVPKLLNKDETQKVVTTESAEMMELRRREIELKERELALREAELSKTAPKTCGGTNGKGEPCKAKADSTGFCKSHQ